MKNRSYKIANAIISCLALTGLILATLKLFNIIESSWITNLPVMILCAIVLLGSVRGRPKKSVRIDERKTDAHIEELISQIKNKDKPNGVVDKATKAVNKVYNSFIGAGFTEEQAMIFTLKTIDLNKGCDE